MKYLLYLLLINILLIPIATSANVGFVSNNIWLSDNNPLDGETVKIYSVIINDSERDIKGSVVFYRNNEAITSPIDFYLEKNGNSKVISIEWTAEYGNSKFLAVMQNVVFINQDGGGEIIDSSLMSQSTDQIFIDIDSDNDGVGNEAEAEQGTDPENPDTDGDGENDGIDPNPIDSSVFSGDDTDNDGISDKTDSDIDNDGLYNFEEEEQGTDPTVFDTDADGYSDKEDFYPLDPLRWAEEGKEIIKDADLSQRKDTNTIKNPVEPQVLGIKEEILINEKGSGSFISASIFKFIFISIGLLLLVFAVLFTAGKKTSRKIEK